MIAELHAVTKRYGDLTALRDVSLALEAGQVTSVLGPNGAGKTTAVKLLIGLTRPTRGTARLFQTEPRSVAARRRTGVMLQISKVPETLTVREHIASFRSHYPAPLSIDDTLSRTGLAAVADRRFGHLSGGQRQRVLFALAICGNPDLLFLDEPTVGLDVESRRAFWQEIRRLASEGRSVVLTTHYLEEADAVSDRIVLLDRGMVTADDTPHAIKARVASRRIRCVTRIDPHVLGQWEDVSSVRLDGAAVEILTRDAERVIREMFARDDRLSALEVTGANLEDACLALTAQRNGGAPSASTGVVP
ncbi:MAG TPA: ABC transporter ATP-binding protein [Vicinamibacterales bacterium]|nr:ABC transporter ATP-binding protein [Vicinamibacterales bacterium]